MPPWETSEIIINILVLLTLGVCGGHFISQDVEMRHGVSLVAQMVKNLPARQETQVPSMGWEDPLEKGMATHSNILVWEFRRRRNLGVGSYSPWFHKESGTTDRLTLSLFMPLIPL